MRGVTSTWPSYVPESQPSSPLHAAAMTNDTRKKRTKQNVRVARRRTPLACVISWMLPFRLTPESSASSRKRRKRGKRSAKIRQVPVVGFQRRRQRKRSVAQKKRPRRKRKPRRSVCALHSPCPVVLTVFVGYEGRSEEGEGRGCKCCEESTPCCESRDRRLVTIFLGQRIAEQNSV
jgi:hypothetical protein